jgi:hypothetical protein
MHHDKFAVEVYKGPVFLGYIKKMHKRVFHKRAKIPLTMTVKAIKKMGD